MMYHFDNFLALDNDVISLKSRPLIFIYRLVLLPQSIQKQIILSNIKNKYPEDHSTVNRIGWKKLIVSKSFLNLESGKVVKCFLEHDYSRKHEKSDSCQLVRLCGGL